jgi:hypothetical protein
MLHYVTLCCILGQDQWRTQKFIFWGVFARNFFRGGGGVQQIQLRTEGKENGDLGAVAP